MVTIFSFDHTTGENREEVTLERFYPSYLEKRPSAVGRVTCSGLATQSGLVEPALSFKIGTAKRDMLTRNRAVHI